MDRMKTLITDRKTQAGTEHEGNIKCRGVEVWEEENRADETHECKARRTERMETQMAYSVKHPFSERTDMP